MFCLLRSVWVSLTTALIFRYNAGIRNNVGSVCLYLCTLYLCPLYFLFSMSHFVNSPSAHTRVQVCAALKRLTVRSAPPRQRVSWTQIVLQDLAENVDWFSIVRREGAAHVTLFLVRTTSGGHDILVYHQCIINVTH